MTKCLVLGGNGFLGSHLVDRLSESGHLVTAFDRFSTAPRYTASGVSRRTGDFLSTQDVVAAVRGQEVVFHFVSLTDPLSVDRDPFMDVRTNLTSGIELFRACADAGVRRIVFASSGGAIYGDQPLPAFHEDAATQPVSPYAIGKLALEGYLRYFRKTMSLDFTVVRISNPYGPRQDPRKRQGVIPIFLSALAQDRPLTVFGDGTMIRDYLYVGDAAAMVARVGTGRPLRDIYNIGSGHGVSINELVSTLSMVTGREPRQVRHPKPATFVDRVVLDPTRYLREFGDDLPETSLAEGIAATWQNLLAETHAGADR